MKGDYHLKRTISAMVGKGSTSHNSREFNAKNTDPNRTPLNISYCNEPIRDVYHKLFDDALQRFNEKQKRSDRRIDDYYEKIRTGKQEKPFHELILQIGNCDDMNATGEYGELAQTVLDEYFRDFQQRNPNLYVFSAHLHMDEATPHIHIDFVPYTTGSKRGLDTRVSLKQALAAQGFTGGTRRETEWNQWVQSEKEQLAAVMERYDIQWQHLGTHEKHLSGLEYEKKMLSQEVLSLDIAKDEIEMEVRNLSYERDKAQERADAAVARMNELSPKVEKIEQFAEKYTGDPEVLLPPAASLESAKSYREKKAKPFFTKLIKLLMALYRKYLDVCSQFQNLQRENRQQSREITSLNQKINDLFFEKEDLQADAGHFQTLCKWYGRDIAMREVESAREGLEEQAAAARAAQRAKHRHDRDER